LSRSFKLVDYNQYYKSSLGCLIFNFNIRKAGRKTEREDEVNSVSYISDAFC